MRVGGRVLGKVLVVGVREEGSEKVKKFIFCLLSFFLIFCFFLLSLFWFCCLCFGFV